VRIRCHNQVVTVTRFADTALGDRELGVLEREGELAALEHALGAAAAGHGGLLALEGPAGIGKTALIRAAAGLGRDRGMIVLQARGVPLEQHFSFGVIQQLFEPLRLGAGDDADSSAGVRGSAELLDGAATLALRAFGHGDGERNDVFGADASFVTLHGLYWLVANLSARAPVLLLIDDCHWADGPSLHFLVHLGARLDGLRTLIVVARRTGDPAAEPDLLRELADLAAEPLRPALLGPAATASLVRGALGEQATGRFCAACHAATGGNPLLVRTLVTALKADEVSPTDEAADQVDTFGLDAVARLLTHHLARFPSGADAFARALAILGDGAPLRQIASLARLPLDTAAVLADGLRAASILAPGPELRFAHPILRAAVEDGMGEERRALAHAQAVAVLAADGAPADRLALHLMHTHCAGDPATAAALQEAARRAVERGAPETAAGYLERALVEPPPAAMRGSLLLELGLAYLASRRDSEAIPLLTEAVQVIDPGERARAALLAGRALGIVGHFTHAAAVLEAGSRDLGASGTATDLELAVDAELLANTWLLADQVPETLERVERFRKETATPGVGRELMHVHLGVDALRRAGPLAEGSAAIDRVLASEALLGAETLVLAWIAMMLVNTDKLQDAERILSPLMREAERRGTAFWVAHLGFPLALVAGRQGQLRRAEGLGRWSLEQKLARGDSEGRPWHLIPLLDALVAQGDLEGAELELARTSVPTEPPAQMGWAILLEARARLRLAQHRPEDALEDLLDAGRRWEALKWNHPGLVQWRADAARALVELGDVPRAARLAAEHLELARLTGLPRVIGNAMVGVAATVPRTVALPLLAEAVGLLEQTPARLDLCRAYVEFGSALRREGKRIDAQEQLRHGLELAHRAGAAPLAARAKDELVAAGGRPRRAVFSGVESLTASELRVARLAVEGATNREIAQRLFVTQKTVETHLRHAFQKLAVGGRDQLRRALAGLW
jgi:DNA-binding CsgD family transcriptional regulator